MDADAIRTSLQCRRSGCSCRRPRGQVHCPAHDDEHPSLSVDQADEGRVLVHCFAGCAQEGVLDALRARGLWSGRPQAPQPRSILNAVACFIEQYVILPSDHAAVAATLWVAHCWTLDAFEVSPYLIVKSAEKRSGKTRLLEVLELLTPHAWRVIQPSEAVLFRKISRDHPVLLLDEADTIFNSHGEQYEPLRAVLNAGFRRGVKVPRCIGEGAKQRLADFEVFCPKAVAAIGNLPDTIVDRGIVLKLNRATPAEQRRIRRLRLREAGAETAPLRAALAQWADAALPNLREARPALPDELDGRAADAWEPLLAVAGQAGDGWYVLAWKAALALSTGHTSEDDSLRVGLLRDIRAVFDCRDIDRLATTDLVEALAADEAAPWGDWHGRRITPHVVARLLRPFGIHPRKWRDQDATARGYAREDFDDAFARYLPLEPPRTPQLHQGADSGDFRESPQTPPVAVSENGGKAVTT